MSPRTLVLVVAALLITGGTVYFAKNWLASQRPAVVEASVEKKTETAILVAAVDLPLGSFIDENHLRWQPWPPDALADPYLLKSVVETADLIGSVVRSPIGAGEPITQRRLVKPGERGFLAAVLRPGFRAVSIPIDAKSGVAGFVFPGDRVDVILSHTITQQDDETTIERQVSETVLTNVRVLAVDQQIEQSDGEPRLAKTATLEVTPQIAEDLAVSQQLGNLSLSLRSLAKNENELGVLSRSGTPMKEPEPSRGKSYTFDSHVSRVVRVGSNTNKTTVDVARGAEKETLSFDK